MSDDPGALRNDAARGCHLERLRLEYEEARALPEPGLVGRCQRLLRRLGAAGECPSFIRRIGLQNRDFTIVADNCWGGYVYRRFGLPYRTPFVGTFLFPSCFVELLADFERVMAEEPVFIDARDSRHRERLGQRPYPIGRLRGGVEVHFLHFASAADAREKWARRLRLIEGGNLLVKMSDRLDPSPELVRVFDALPFRHKLFLAAGPHPVPCARSPRDLDLKALLNGMLAPPRG